MSDIETLQRGDSWILITGKMPANPAKGFIRDTFSHCWTGTQWSNVASFAMPFRSHEVANEYISKNKSQMKA